MHVYGKTKETTFLLHSEMRCDRQRNFAVVMAITFLVPRVVAFITFFGFFFFLQLLVILVFVVISQCDDFRV